MLAHEVGCRRRAASRRRSSHHHRRRHRRSRTGTPVATALDVVLDVVVALGSVVVVLVVAFGSTVVVVVGACCTVPVAVEALPASARSRASAPTTTVLLSSPVRAGSVASVSVPVAV